MGMNRNVEMLIVDSNTGNDKSLTVLDLSSFTNLRVFEVDDYSFCSVNEVELIGLNRMERVVIGKHCFRGSSATMDDNHFYLKNCERLRELRIGCYSFSEYSVCEIENVPSLEVIKMGELNEDSSNFRNASLELKSDSERMK